MGDIPVEQRSPSPEPIFDKNGQRVNSRLVLRRQKLERERTALVESLNGGLATIGWPTPYPDREQWAMIVGVSVGTLLLYFLFRPSAIP